MSSKEIQYIFEEACEHVLKSYERKEIFFFSEGDLKCVLFSECLFLMKRRKIETPYPIWTDEKGFYKSLTPDLTLGRKREVVVETKFFGRTTPDKSEIGEVMCDLQKLDRYLSEGASFANFILIDESGVLKKIPELDKLESWKEINRDDKKIDFLFLARFWF
jgi:hypothetical protein